MIFLASLCAILVMARHLRIVYWIFGLRVYTLLSYVKLALINSPVRMWVRPPLTFSEFFRRGVFEAISECWARPVYSAPSRVMDVLRRSTQDEKDGQLLVGVINFASYDYWGISGRLVLPIDDERYTTWRRNPKRRLQSEQLIQRELGAIFERPAEAVVIGTTGYGTNAHIAAFIPSVLASLYPERDGVILVLSDELNHSSTVQGLQNARQHMPVVKRIFHHNDVDHLARIYKDEMSRSNGVVIVATLVIVEGIYSMEGHMCPLDRLVAWKHSQDEPIYLMMDEAHSFGACGPRGRGVADHYRIPMDCVDFSMVTFSKITSAIGGAIICPTPSIADAMRNRYLSTYEPPLMCAGISQQIVGCLMDLRNGSPNIQNRLYRLQKNSQFLRNLLLTETQAEVIGDTAIVLITIRDVTKAPAMNQRLLELGFATVLVGYPAVSLSDGCRLRFCVNAEHTEDNIRQLVAAVRQVRREFSCVNVARRTIDPPKPAAAKCEWKVHPIPEAPVQYISRRYVKRINAIRNDSDSDENVNVRYTLQRYGVGSHGPRNFYGTTEKHLELETVLADFYGRKHCVLFPEGQTVLEGIVPVLKSTTPYPKKITIVTPPPPHQGAVAKQLLRLVIEAHGDVCAHESAPQPMGVNIYWSQHQMPDPESTSSQHYHCVAGTLEGEDVALLGGFVCLDSDDIASAIRLFARPYVFSASMPPYICEYVRQLLVDNMER